MSLKLILRESKLIRFYLSVVGTLIIGVLLVLPYRGGLSIARYFAAGGVILGIGSFIALLIMMDTIDQEVKIRFQTATTSGKLFLNSLFYFAWGQVLFLGLIVWGISLSQTGISGKKLVEIKGEISNISVVGNKSRSLKIELFHFSNEYEIATHLVWYETLEKIERELHPGMVLYLTILEADENKTNDLYVPIYGMRTENSSYFTVEDYQREDEHNTNIGIYLGIAFTIGGLTLLISSRWQFQKYLRRIELLY